MKVQKRRRREWKTDYGKRLKLLKSGSPRVIFRKTNRYIIAQYVTSREAQDKTLVEVNSKNLIRYGWPEEMKGSLKSLPASYLVGLLLGKKIIKEKLKKPIIDFGIDRSLDKSRAYSFVKGLIDAGIEIKYKEKIFPNEDRIKGKHMKKDFSKIFEKIKSKLENS